MIRDFYALVLPDGSRTDSWEQWLGEVESRIAPALKRAIHMPQFRLTDDDRADLACWIALQYLRGPDNRRQMCNFASIGVRAQVGMGGFEYLRYTMSRGMNRDVSTAEAEEAWADITSDDGPQVVVSGDEHLRILRRTYDEATSMIFTRSWVRIRFNRQRLAVSDSPVNLVRGEGFHEAGLVGAPTITVPLDRETLLLLERRGEQGPVDDRDASPTGFLARTHNTLAAYGAERFLYFHPEDDPIPSEIEIPRPQPPRLRASGPDLINRDRPLASVLDQIAAFTGSRADTLMADYTWPIPGYRPRATRSNSEGPSVL